MAFAVTIEPSGRTFVAEAAETVLLAAIRQGVGLPYGCKDGACGSCKCRLIDGRIAHGVHQQKALSDDESSRGLILACRASALTDLVIEARTVAGAGEIPIRKMPSRVASIKKPARDVAILRLSLPANEPFLYRAGQYVEFILRDGGRRSYSMACAPAADGKPPALELHVRHMPGGKFTDHVFSAMKEGEILRVEGPYGSFFLRESEKPMILLASGTGFAPIKAILEQMIEAGSERHAELYWGCRTRADLYLHDWALDAVAKLPNLRYVPVLSEPTPADGWAGRIGLVHQAVIHDHPSLLHWQVYACGAPVMVKSAEHDFVVTCGLPDDEFYADAFTTEKDKVAQKA